MPAAGLPPGHHVLEVGLDGGGLARRQVSHHLQTEKTRSLDLFKETLFNFKNIYISKKYIQILCTKYLTSYTRNDEKSEDYTHIETHYLVLQSDSPRPPSDGHCSQSCYRNFIYISSTLL